MLRDGDCDRFLVRLYHELSAHRGGGDVMTLDGKGPGGVACHGESGFSTEQVNVSTLWRKHHIERGVGIQHHAGAVFQHNVFLLSDRCAVVGRLEMHVREEWLPDEITQRQKDAGDKAPLPEAGPPSTVSDACRRHELGRYASWCVEMADLFPQDQGIPECELMRRTQVLPGFTGPPILVGSLAGVKPNDPFQGFVVDRGRDLWGDRVGHPSIRRTHAGRVIAQAYGARLLYKTDRHALSTVMTEQAGCRSPRARGNASALG